MSYAKAQSRIIALAMNPSSLSCPHKEICESIASKPLPTHDERGIGGAARQLLLVAVLSLTKGDSSQSLSTQSTRTVLLV